MQKTVTGRSPEEEHIISGILLCIGANWKSSFVPEDELLEAANEFLKIPAYDQLFELIKTQKIKLHVADKATRERQGCWLSFSR